MEAFLTEALPTDEPSRAFHLLGGSYAVLVGQRTAQNAMAVQRSDVDQLFGRPRK